MHEEMFTFYCIPKPMFSDCPILEIGSQEWMSIVRFTLSLSPQAPSLTPAKGYIQALENYVGQSREESLQRYWNAIHNAQGGCEFFDTLLTLRLLEGAFQKGEDSSQLRQRYQTFCVRRQELLKRNQEQYEEVMLAGNSLKGSV